VWCGFVVSECEVVGVKRYEEFQKGIEAGRLKSLHRRKKAE